MDVMLAMSFHIKLKKLVNWDKDRFTEQRELKTFHRLRGFRSDGSVMQNQEEFEDLNDELEFQLFQKDICIEAVQQLASKGLHHGSDLRPTLWKVLVGYLPLKRDLWEDELTRNRLRYSELKKEFLPIPSENASKNRKENNNIGFLKRHKIKNEDHPLSLKNGSTWLQYFKDIEIYEQIDRDLQRTHPDIDFFSVNSPKSQKNQEAMKNILLLFAKLNPAIGYVQGMNEILAPLYYTLKSDPNEQNSLNAEADSFGCFVRLLSGFVDNYCQQLDNSSVGINSTILQLSELLKANDKELWDHLEKNKANPQFYAFRWITLLLAQEFEFDTIMIIWDCLLSNPQGVQEMLLRVCCAMLLCVRDELLRGDFAGNVKLLQNYPQIDLAYLLQVSHNIIRS